MQTVSTMLMLSYADAKTKTKWQDDKNGVRGKEDKTAKKEPRPQQKILPKLVPRAAVGYV